MNTTYCDSCIRYIHNSVYSDQNHISLLFDKNVWVCAWQNTTPGKRFIMNNSESHIGYPLWVRRVWVEREPLCSIEDWREKGRARGELWYHLHLTICAITLVLDIICCMLQVAVNICIWELMLVYVCGLSSPMSTMWTHPLPTWFAGRVHGMQAWGGIACRI